METRQLVHVVLISARAADFIPAHSGAVGEKKWELQKRLRDLYQKAMRTVFYEDAWYIPQSLDGYVQDTDNGKVKTQWLQAEQQERVQHQKQHDEEAKNKDETSKNNTTNNSATAKDNTTTSTTSSLLASSNSVLASTTPTVSSGSSSEEKKNEEEGGRDIVIFPELPATENLQQEMARAGVNHNREGALWKYKAMKSDALSLSRLTEL